MDNHKTKNKATFHFLSMKAEAEGIDAVKVLARICFCGMITTLLLAILAIFGR